MASFRYHSGFSQAMPDRVRPRRTFTWHGSDVVIRGGVDSAQNPIFVVGCPRSGTSLVRDLLRAHRHLSFPSASFFIPRLYKAYAILATRRKCAGWWAL